MRKEILSAMQWSIFNKTAPYDIRLAGVFDEWASRWHMAMWELENLAHFNQSVYGGVKERLDKSEALLSEYKRIQQIAVEDDSMEASFKEQKLVRMRQSMMINDDVADAVARYADEVTIIAVWAFIEKHLNHALIALQARLNIPQATDHRWPNIEQAYIRCGIDLSKISAFADANECRQVNNAIKHGGVVSNALGARPSFAGKVGLPLETIVLDVQRYYLSAGDFTSAALEECSNIAGKQAPSSP